VALGLVLVVPSLWVGPVLDDWLFVQAIESGRWWDLYDFVGPGEIEGLRASGWVPWWVAEDFEQRFFRPFSSVLFWLDHRMGPVFTGLSLMGWRALALWGGWAVLSQELPRRVALWALFLLVTDNALVAAGAWHANRHALISAALGLWSVALLQRGRRGMSALLFGLALCAGELGLGTLGFVLAWAVHRRSVRESLPHLSVFALWLALYRSLGMGARGGDFYLDPISDPAGWIRAAPLRWLALVGDGVTQLPAMLGFLEGWAPIGLALVGIFALWVFRGAGWLGWGALLALVPALSAPPSSRQLAVASVGFAAVLARRLPAPALGLLGMVGMALSLGSQVGLRRVGEDSLEIAARIDAICPGMGPVAVVNPPDHVVGFYLPVLRQVGLGLPPRVVLGLSIHLPELRVRGGATVELEGRFGAGQIERFWAKRMPTKPVETGGMQVQLVGEVLSVQAPEDTCWVAWDEGVLVRFEPGPVEVRLERTPGPSGLP